MLIALAICSIHLVRTYRVSQFRMIFRYTFLYPSLHMIFSTLASALLYFGEKTLLPWFVSSLMIIYRWINPPFWYFKQKWTLENVRQVHITYGCRLPSSFPPTQKGLKNARAGACAVVYPSFGISLTWTETCLERPIWHWSLKINLIFLHLQIDGWPF